MTRWGISWGGDNEGWGVDWTDCGLTWAASFRLALVLGRSRALGFLLVSYTDLLNTMIAIYNKHTGKKWKNTCLINVTIIVINVSKTSDIMITISHAKICRRFTNKTMGDSFLLPKNVKEFNLFFFSHNMITITWRWWWGIRLREKMLPWQWRSWRWSPREASPRNY